MSALAIEGAVKTFPGVRALDGVRFSVEAGSIHALLGENGAGKSTLVKIIAGVHRPDQGRILLHGRDVSFASPRASIAAGIAVVHQERNLIPRFSVAENIALEHLPTRGPMIDRAAMDRAAQTWIDALELDVAPATPVRELGPARMQLVEIAKALSLDARVILLDEPTASITPHEADRLFTILRRLRDEGRALVFVSHKLDEVFALCDTVTVLRDGRNVCDGVPIRALDRAQVVRMMVGREERHVSRRAPKGTAAPALELRGVSTAAGHRGIDLCLRRGELLGLYGLVGAGRSELAKAIIGLIPITGGELSVDGRPARIASPTEALRRYRIGYVSEDRKQEGLILAHDVQRNIVISAWSRIAGTLGLLTDRRERSSAAPLVERLKVRTPSMRQTVGHLSGGNQQKVSVAKWLAAQAEILLVDEPTVGIDVDTKAYLHEVLLELAQQGTAILLISSDLPEMVALADRIVVMGGFRIQGELVNDRDYDAMSHRIMDLIHRAADEPAAVAL
jgi:ribose transport system ATP-binding protein